MALFLKNNSGASDSWDGVTIADQAYYLMTTAEQKRFGENDQTVSDIGSGNLIVALMNDGTADLTNPAEGLQTLYNLTPTELANPFPLNKGKYSFRGQGIYNAINGSGTNNGITDVDIEMIEGRWINGAEVFLTDSGLFGVYLDFQIVDVDNILGYGAGFVVEQFGDDWQLDPRNKNKCFPGYLAYVPQDLYVRTKVFNPNSNACNIGINLHLHKI